MEISKIVFFVDENNFQQSSLTLDELKLGHIILWCDSVVEMCQDPENLLALCHPLRPQLAALVHCL